MPPARYSTHQRPLELGTGRYWIVGSRRPGADSATTIGCAANAGGSARNLTESPGSPCRRP